MLSTQSDERLVDLVRVGSDAAFETIVERYRRALMRYVTRLLPAERAEDVVQQSFVKAYEAIRRDEAEIALRPWLYRIAHNNALNALRDRGLRHAELDDQFDGVERPDQALERSQDLRDVVLAVQALPERQRDAILLRELEGRSYEEIAAALGVTDGAVRQLLNRARNTLRNAAAALTPTPLLTRVASAETAELVGVGAGSALAAKAAATVLVTGAVVGGAAVAPRVGGDQPRAAAGDAVAAEERSAPSGEGTHAPRADGEQAVSTGDRSGHRGGDDDNDRHEDRSGPGGGGDDDPPDDRDDHSGPGDGGDDDEPEVIEEAREDRSGPGGGGSGSGSSDSGGSGISGSGTSGSGDSGSSGSDSGSSGSGSGELEEPDDDFEPDNSGPGSTP